MVNWIKSLDLERKASAYFDNVYRKIWNIKHIKVVRDSDFGIRSGIDKILTLKDGTKITIEEKVRSKKYANDDIVIEEQSNVEKDTPGWIYYSKADYLSYSWFVNGFRKILIIDMRKLRKWYLRNKERYNLVLTDTDARYHTSFRIIPLRDLNFNYVEL